VDKKRPSNAGFSLSAFAKNENRGADRDQERENRELMTDFWRERRDFCAATTKNLKNLPLKAFFIRIY
jgi:hypothetical protein